MSALELKPSQRVRVEETIRTREGDWKTVTEGEVVYFAPHPTGSWFAHGKNDKLWLNRLRLRRDDGELVELNIGPDTRVIAL